MPAQVFVANPNKPPQIEAILRRNKAKLVSFLQNFHNDREGEPALPRKLLPIADVLSPRSDEQFNVRRLLRIVRPAR